MAIRRNGRRQQTPREMNGKLAPTNFWSAGSLIDLWNAEFFFSFLSSRGAVANNKGKK